MRCESHRAITKDILGEYTQTNFVYGVGTTVEDGCSIEYKNQFLVFGGYNNTRQVKN